MPNLSWNKPALGLVLYALTGVVLAQVQAAAPPAGNAPVPFASESADALVDALTCRIPHERYPNLMQLLRRERVDEFAQTYRQYSDPAWDLYQLETRVHVWGNESDAIVIASNRVMMAVAGSLDEVTQRLEHALEQSSQSPLSGALDDQHALVIFEARRPGLEGRVLLGCEYRIPDISLLDDPDDAWRKQLLDPSSPPTP